VTTVEQSIDVGVPVRTAYDQWTQFEEFPSFMQGVERVEQRTPTTLHWVTKVAGVQREFDAEISEQVPDDRIAWTSVSGPRQAGVVTFHRLDETRTRVMLQMEFEPQGLVEQAGDKLGFVDARVSGDLRKFKQFIEERGAQSGAWRGRVEPPHQVASPPEAAEGGREDLTTGAFYPGGAGASPSGGTAAPTATGAGPLPGAGPQGPLPGEGTGATGGGSSEGAYPPPAPPMGADPAGGRPHADIPADLEGHGKHRRDGDFGPENGPESGSAGMPRL